jgi:hypothetical protein
MASSASSFNLCVADRITFFGRNRRMARSPRPTTVAAANAGLPAWVKPQLTQLVTEAPGGDEWAHELKFDGYRMHARLDRGDVCLLTRTGLDSHGVPTSSGLDRHFRSEVRALYDPRPFYRCIVSNSHTVAAL